MAVVGSAKERAAKRQSASAKRQMSALAAGFLQNAEIPTGLTQQLSAPVTKVLQEGFVVDTSTPSDTAAVDVSAHIEHLEFQHALVARTANALPAFEAGVRVQEMRARTLPFELGEDTRRTRARGLGGVAG